MSKYENSKKQGIKSVLPGIFILIGILAFVGIVGFIGYNFLSEDDPKREESQFEVDIQATYNPTKGNPDSQVVLVYFADYECSACRNNAPIMDSIANRYTDNVLFVYKHLPLESIHPSARIAGRAAQAAHNQNLFFEYTSRVYELQDTGFSNSNINDLAEEVGMDVEKFNLERKSDETDDIVDFDLQDLEDLDLTSCSQNNSLDKRAGSLRGVGTPLSILYKSGQIIDCWSGGLPESVLSSKLDQALGLVEESSDQLDEVTIQPSKPLDIQETEN